MSHTRSLLFAVIDAAGAPGERGAALVAGMPDLTKSGQIM